MKEKITMEEKLTENFSLNEFDCRDGTPVPTDLIPNVLELAKNLQIIFKLRELQKLLFILIQAIGHTLIILVLEES